VSSRPGVVSAQSDRAMMSYICPSCMAGGDELQAFSLELAGRNIRDALAVVRITCRRCSTQVFWNRDLREPKWVIVG